MLSTDLPRQIRAMLFGCIIALFILNVIKGLRLPNIWSYTHYLFNYSEGFNKRSLVGEIIRLVDIPFLSTYFGFVTFAFFVFALCIGLLMRMMRNLSTHDNLLSLCVLFVFCTNVSVVYFTHTVGYFDQIGLFITIAIIAVQSFQWRLVLATLLCPIAILVHEAFLILFFPIILFSFLIQNEVRPILTSVSIAGLTSVVVLVSSIATHVTISPGEIEAMQKSLQSTSSIELRPDAFEVLARTAHDNLMIMKNVWSHPGSWVYLFYSLAGTAPTTVFIIAASYMLARRDRIVIPVRIVLIGISLSPLAMHIVAWDKERFNSLAVISAFLVFYLIAMRAKEGSAYPKTVSYPVVLIAIVLSILNFGTDMKLFDDYKIEFFPYINSIHEILENIISGSPIFVIPTR